MNLLQTSLLASLLIVIICIVRWLWINALPKKTLLLLWGLALLQLALPASLPSLVYSSPAVRRILPPVSLEAPAALAETAPPQLAAVADAVRELSAAPAHSISPIYAVWFAGAVALVLFFLLSHLRCRRRYSTSLPLESQIADSLLRRQPTLRTVKIKTCSSIISPMTYGVLRPVILLPQNTDLENKEHLTYILTHELVHIRRWDVAAKWLLAAVLCLHWFNPLVWVMYILANRDIELSCDETVLRTLGEAAKTAYARTLIHLEEKRSITPFGSAFSKSAIRERIVAIMKLRKKSVLGGFLAAVVVVLATGGFLVSGSALSPLPLADRAVVPTSPRGTVSVDGGKTWLTEETFQKFYPLPEIEWYTAEEYAAVLEGAGRRSAGHSTANIEEMETTFEIIKAGGLVSKTINSSKNPVMVLESGGEAPFKIGYMGQGMKEPILLGPFTTIDDMLIATHACNSSGEIVTILRREPVTEEESE